MSTISIVSLVLSIAAVALALLANAVAFDRRRTRTPTRRPTLIGHRPGVGRARVGDTLMYDPFCDCGWKGFTTTDEEKARKEASDHAKGFLPTPTRAP